MPMSKKQLRQWRERIDAIIQNQDWDAMFQLADSGDFALCLTDPLWRLADGSPDRLNHPQRVLFLCILLEDCTQCDSLYSFFDEGFGSYGQETAEALDEIGASKSAAILRKVLSKLPEGGFPTEDRVACRALDDGAFGKVLDEANHMLCNYPDGPMCDLYFAYAKAHREDFP